MYQVDGNTHTLIGMILKLVEQGHTRYQIDDIIRHANYYSRKENLDMLDCMYGTMKRNCVGVSGGHSHAKDKGAYINSIWQRAD